MGRSPLPFHSTRERRKGRRVDSFTARREEDSRRDKNRYETRKDQDVRVEQGDYGGHSRTFTDSRSSSRHGYRDNIVSRPRQDSRYHSSRDDIESRDEHSSSRKREDFSTPRKVSFEIKSPEAPRKEKAKENKDTPKKSEETAEKMNEEKGELNDLEKLKNVLAEKEKEITGLRKRATTKTRTLEILADTHKKNTVLQEKIDKLEEDFKVERTMMKKLLEEATGDNRKASENEHDYVMLQVGQLQEDVVQVKKVRDSLKKEMKKKDNVLDGYEVEVEALGKKLDEKDEWILELEKRMESKQKYVEQMEIKLAGFGKCLEGMNFDKDHADVDNANDDVKGNDGDNEEGKSDDESDDDSNVDRDESMEDEEEVSVSNEVLDRGESCDNSEVGGGSQDIFESVVEQESLNLLNSEDVFLPSDEEFAEEQLHVRRTVVSNYSKKRESLSTNVEIPKNLVNEKDKFKASTVSLNNKLVFLATCLHEIPHRGDKRICKLSPACNIFLENGDPIAKVKILVWEGMEVPAREIWCCAHHARASARGYGLQTQRYQGCLGNKRVVEVKDDEDKVEKRKKLDGDEKREGSDDDEKRKESDVEEDDENIGACTQKLVDDIVGAVDKIKEKKSKKEDMKKAGLSRKKKRTGVEDVKRAIKDYEEAAGEKEKKK